MQSSRRVLFWIFAILIFSGVSSALMAWVDPVVIANDPGKFYEDKVSVKFGRLGEVFVCFMTHDEAKVRKEIWLYKYTGTGKRGELVGMVSGPESQKYCYEPDMVTTADGTVHITWAEAASGKVDLQSIMYRYLTPDGVWSKIIKLKTMNVPGTINTASFNKEKIDDLKIAVDSKGNVFVTFMIWPLARCKFLSRYGTTVTEERFPVAGRSKHSCVRADDKYVHLAWQQYLAYYTVCYARRANTPGAAWKWWNVQGGIHRPMMDLDEDGNPHIAYMADDGGGRQVVYKNRINEKFSTRLTLTEYPSVYQNVDIAVNNRKNMIVSAGLFAGVNSKFFFNWKKNGEWPTTGMSLVPGATGDFDFPAVALSKKDVGAFVYSTKREVYLVTSEEIVVNELPVPVIDSNKDEYYFGDQVVFNGRGSSDPDGSIVKYEWDFGDGVTAQGIEASHTYLDQAGEMEVKLTVTDNKGAVATATKAINVLIQPPHPVITWQPDVVYWQDTVLLDGSGSADPFFDIVKYEWDFGDGSTAVGKTVSHPYVNRYGDMQVKLTVTNEKLVSATAVKTLKVNALYSANATATKKKFRTIFLDRFGYEIAWAPNPKNSQDGYTVVKYRILRKTGADLTYTQVAEVAPTATLYRDLSIEQSTDYAYAVCAVDAQGHVSPVDNL